MPVADFSLAGKVAIVTGGSRGFGRSIALGLAEAPPDRMLISFLMGLAYGVGGTAFNISIRYIGFSVTYAIAIGISCVLGTLLPPLLEGKLGAVFQQTGAGWVAAGIAVAACGILVSGLAGWFKDHDLRASATLPEDFHLGKGLFFCVLAGILSAVFGISLNEGKPIAELAAARQHAKEGRRMPDAHNAKLTALRDEITRLRKRLAEGQSHPGLRPDELEALREQNARLAQRLKDSQRPPAPRRRAPSRASTTPCRGRARASRSRTRCGRTPAPA